MTTAPIDYAALAKKYGAISSTPAPSSSSGNIDYAALAAKFGGTTTPGSSSVDTPPPIPSSVPVPAGLQGQPSSNNAPRAGGIMDTIGNVGTHLKNMVVGPYQALTAPPDPGVEAGIAAGGGQGALGLYRMTAEPTVNAIGTGVQQYKQGNIAPPSNYDAQGNYQPSAMSSAMDAIPMVGPWARNIENDAQQKGVVPALAGLATDIAAPKAASKVVGAGLRTAGFGAQYASATEPARNVALTRTLVPGSPSELLTRALKPSVANPDFEANAQASLPAILQQNPAPGVQGFADAAETAKNTAGQQYQDILAPYRSIGGAAGPVRPGSISGSSIAAAQNASIPAINRFESPTSAAIPPSDWTAKNPFTPPSSIVQSTAQKASMYAKSIDIPTADALREDANAKLNAFYSKAGGDRNAALSNPETARIKAIGDGVRQQLYPLLDNNASLQPGTTAGIQDLYGNLSDVSTVAGKRATVFGRQNPYSLQESIAMSGGNPLSAGAAYAGQRLLKQVTDSDALTNAAVDRFRSPSGPSMTARPGLAPRAFNSTGKAILNTGRNIYRAPLSANPFFYSLNPPRSK